MNYVDDDWMNEFTDGQKDRVWTQIAMFRSGLLGSGDSERIAESGVEIIW